MFAVADARLQSHSARGYTRRRSIQHKFRFGKLMRIRLRLVL